LLVFELTCIGLYSLFSKRRMFMAVVSQSGEKQQFFSPGMNGIKGYVESYRWPCNNTMSRVGLNCSGEL